jgi:hypothetical protein
VTYHCGTYGLESIGIPSDTPRIVCDGCRIIYRIPRRGAVGAPPAWFLNGNAPPRWRKDEGADGLRRDYCPGCAAAIAPGGDRA